MRALGELPTPDTQADEAAAECDDPSVEAQLLFILRTKLRNPEIDLDSNFFQAGGHSLLAVRFHIIRNARI